MENNEQKKILSSSDVAEEKEVAKEAPAGENIAELTKKYDELQQKFDQVRDQVARAYAEIQNTRQRANLDIEQGRVFALEKFVLALLPVLDSLEHAAEKSVEPGIEMIFNMMFDVFKSFEVTDISPKEQIFNPHEHEAIATEKQKDKKDGYIVKVLQRGYKLHKRVIRPARVIVNKLEE